MYKDLLKSFKLHQERQTIAEYTSTSYKMKKTNSDFRLNFCAGEAYIKMKDVQQI